VRYVLDTTVVIDHVYGYTPAGDLLDRLFAETSDMYTCAVVTCEALSKGDDRDLATKRALLDALEYVELSPADARWAGGQRHGHAQTTRRVPSTTDALIAALAHSLGATVVTRDAKDFAAFDVPVLGYGQATD
jgi:predicted nucleic acid-binding protein